MTDQQPDSHSAYGWSARPRCVLFSRLVRLAANGQSLEVNYIDLANTLPTIAIWVADHPKEVLPILHETAKEVSKGCWQG